MPDLDKIVTMSRIFGVSTDYLLKEEKEDTDIVQLETDFSDNAMEGNNSSSYNTTKELIRELSAEEVEDYQCEMFRIIKKIAIGVFLCIFGVVVGIGTDFITLELLSMDENDFQSIPLLICIAIAISQFIPAGLATEKFEYLKHESFILPQSLKLRIRSEADDFYRKFVTKVTIGVVLILLGVILCAAMEMVSDVTDNICWDEYAGPGILLFLVAIATYLFITMGMKQDMYNILLQEKDYSADHKRRSKESDDLTRMIAAGYWCIITAVFLGYGFLTSDWGRSWIIWPVAGCIFSAILAFVNIYQKKMNKNS